ncbi:hypothetical protein [Mycobacterium sp. SM1]|uniref:hypothetical protein n=1 Tax=Mycobacterium sp. SM1 TaxID=2816243 RepID=UPI001F266715|nr:hypothetical protein [Mycobacterium sp. SM1]
MGEFIARSRAVKADPAWQAARGLPRRSPAERAARRAVFRAAQTAHGFSVDAAQSFASSLRRSWVGEHLAAQKTQNLGSRAFDAVKQWHLGQRGKPMRPTRHRVGEGKVSFDLGPSQLAVAVSRADGSWSGWVQPLADALRLDMLRLRRAQRRLDRQHRAGSPGCFTRGGHSTGRCGWQRSTAARRAAARVGESHRRLAEHRKTLHGALGNRLLG